MSERFELDYGSMKGLLDEVAWSGASFKNMPTVIHDPNQPVMIRRFDFEYQAELARVLLEAADIPSMLIRDACSGVGTGGVQIAVRRRDVYDALEALGTPPDDEAPRS